MRKAISTDELVAYIASSGQVPIGAIQARFSLRFDAARNALRKARDLGLIVCMNAARNSVWMLPNVRFQPVMKPPKPRKAREYASIPVKQIKRSANDAPAPVTRAVNSVWELGKA